MKAITINLNDFFKSLPVWNVESYSGYKPLTSFWQDFSIADAAYKWGESPTSAIRKTYRTAFEEWRGNYKYLTELVMVLNHKIWYHYEAAKQAEKAGYLNARDFHDTISRLYDELWRECDAWCCENLTGDEADYFYQTLD